MGCDAAVISSAELREDNPFSFRLLVSSCEGFSDLSDAEAVPSTAPPGRASIASRDRRCAGAMASTIEQSQFTSRLLCELARARPPATVRTPTPFPARRHASHHVDEHKRSTMRRAEGLDDRAIPISFPASCELARARPPATVRTPTPFPARRHASHHVDERHLDERQSRQGIDDVPGRSPRRLPTPASCELVRARLQDLSDADAVPSTAPRLASAGRASTGRASTASRDRQCARGEGLTTKTSQVPSRLLVSSREHGLQRSFGRRRRSQHGAAPRVTWTSSRDHAEQNFDDRNPGFL